MRVVKFGGSSVADSARLRRVAAIVAELHASGPVAVVVSAMEGITDALLRVGRSAIAGGVQTPELLDEIAARHYEAWAAFGVETPGEFERLWAALVAEAHTLAPRSIGLSASARVRLIARFSGWGERLIVGLLAAALQEAGLIAEAYHDAPVALHVDGGEDDEPQPSALATRARLLPELAMLVMRGGVPVLPGYIARSTVGALTTLGRNGSDHSAAVVAAALGAERLTIYSDVPGMLTADPRIVDDAALLPALTYAEAQRMATLGAKALHPRTIEPVARWAIPVELRSSMSPHAAGTDILSASLGRTREGAWFVASRTLAEANGALAEVTAEYLPAWPLDDTAPEPCDGLAVARTTLRDAGIAAHALTPTAQGVRARVDASSAPATVRALHTALRRCSALPRRSTLALATGA